MQKAKTDGLISLNTRPTGKRIRENNERIILKAAEVAFSETGFKGTSVTRIANLAGIPKANVHYYFPRKIDIYREVIDRVCQLWLDAADFRGSDEPETALRNYISAKMDLAYSEPLGSKLWAMEVLTGAPILGEFIREKLLDWFELEKAQVQSWIDQGLIDTVDVQTLFYMIWASTQHYADFSAQTAILNGDKALSRDQFETAKGTISQVILKGVGL